MIAQLKDNINITYICGRGSSIISRPYGAEWRSPLEHQAHLLWVLSVLFVSLPVLIVNPIQCGVNRFYSVHKALIYPVIPEVARKVCKKRVFDYRTNTKIASRKRPPVDRRRKRSRWTSLGHIHRRQYRFLLISHSMSTPKPLDPQILSRMAPD